MRKKTNRRKFIKHTTIASVAAMIIPRHVLGGVGYVSPSDQIRIATIGAGGKVRVIHLMLQV